MITPWHKLVSLPLRARMRRIRQQMDDPMGMQERLFQHLIKRGRETHWGQQYDYASIDRLARFQERVPVSTYEQLAPWIERCLQGEADVLWPGKVSWFAMSSGTTNDRSKFIPVTRESLLDNHYTAGKDMIALYLASRPDSKVFTGKTLSIGGSHQINRYNQHARYGDVSAVLLENLPALFRLQRAPRKAVALMDEWEQKIETMARETMHQNITALLGVPTWMLVLINRILELSGNDRRNLLDIWPNLEVFFHGAVNFAPYRPQFEALLPDANLAYRESYNASEGFFATQFEAEDPGMLMLLDHGVFYELVPMDEVHKPYPKTYTLDEAEVGQLYALVITTNGGLWRYMIGDTIRLTSNNPPKLVVAGRTKHFINAFGEEVVIEHAEDAVATACEATGAQVADYTAAPIYLEGTERGGHEWLVEFTTAPDSLDRFRDLLDQRLQAINSDYEAKRSKGLALGPPVLHSVPPGTFYAWLKSQGKEGGQHKIPRLRNNREVLESVKATAGSLESAAEG
jgi:hypothetical protein